MAKQEYVQTYQARTSTAEPMSLNPPPGEGWALHSWQPESTGQTALILVWQRSPPGKEAPPSTYQPPVLSGPTFSQEP